MNILQISVGTRREAANSTRLANSITARLQSGHPATGLTLCDHAVAPHPVPDEAALGALFAPADKRSAVQAARLALDGALIAEVQAADTIVLGVPGMSDVHFIHAEGLNMGAESAARGFVQAEADLAAALA